MSKTSQAEQILLEKKKTRDKRPKFKSYKALETESKPKAVLQNETEYLDTKPQSPISPNQSPKLSNQSPKRSSLKPKRGSIKQNKSKLDFVPARYDAQGRPRKTNKTRKWTKPMRTKVESDADLKKLTHEWYMYLKEKGFNDLEYYNTDSGVLREDLNGTSTLSMYDRYKPAQERFYYMMRNYFTHSKASWFESRQIRYCFKLYSQGKTYRDISASFKNWSKYENRSTYWVFTKLKPVIEQALLWNKTDEEGLLYDGSPDIVVDEVLLNETKWEEYYDKIEDDEG